MAPCPRPNLQRFPSPRAPLSYYLNRNVQQIVNSLVDLSQTTPSINLCFRRQTNVSYKRRHNQPSVSLYVQFAGCPQPFRASQPPFPLDKADNPGNSAMTVWVDECDAFFRRPLPYRSAQPILQNACSRFVYNIYTTRRWPP